MRADLENGDFATCDLTGWDASTEGGGLVAAVQDIRSAGNCVGQVRGAAGGPGSLGPTGQADASLVTISALDGPALTCQVRFRVEQDTGESALAEESDFGLLSLSVVDAPFGVPPPPKFALLRFGVVRTSAGDDVFEIATAGQTVLVPFAAPDATVGAVSTSGAPSDPLDPLGSAFLTVTLDVSDIFATQPVLTAGFGAFVLDFDDGLDLAVEIDNCRVGAAAPAPPEALAQARATVADTAADIATFLVSLRAGQINHHLIGSGGAATKLAQASTFLAQGKSCPAADKEAAAVQKLRAAETQLAGFSVCPDGAGCVAALDRVRGLAVLHRARAEARSSFHRLCDEAPQCAACGPDPCTAPGTIVVVPSGQPTIADALSHIGATGTVILDPGVYLENVVIAAGRHVVLRGAGEAGSARIIAADAGKPTVTVDAGASACVAGLGLEGGASGLAAGALGAPAGTIALRDAKVAGNAGDGLLVFAADLRVIDTTVSGNGGAGGFALADNLRVARSLVADNRAGGWGGLGDCALGTLEAVYEWTLFSFSEGAGLSIVAAEDLSVGHNIFVLNDGSGLAIDCSSDISIFNNGSVENGLFGCEIEDSSAIGLHTNFVDRSAQSGVRLDSPTAAYLEDNTITRNGASALDAGIFATDVELLLLIDNPSISNNAGSGVLVSEGDGVVLDDNVADGNAVGLDIGGVTALSVESNLTSFNAGEGLRVADAPGATVAFNLALDNGAAGIEIAGSDDAVLTENTADFNDAEGIKIAWSDGAVLTENTAGFNDGSGFVVEGSSGVSLDSDVAYFNGNHGVHLASSADAVVSDASVTLSGMLVPDTPCAQAGVDSIDDYGHAGVLVESSAGAAVVESVVSENLCGGVLVVGSSDATVSGNNASAGGGIVENGGWGVLVVDSASVLVSDNLIADTGTVTTDVGPGRWGDGVAGFETDAGPATSMDVLCNVIEDNERAGVLFFGAGGSACGNIITGSDFAIALQAGSDPDLCAVCDPDDCDDACDEDCLCFTGNGRDEVVVGQGLEPPPSVKPPEDGP